MIKRVYFCMRMYECVRVSVYVSMCVNKYVNVVRQC